MQVASRTDRGGRRRVRQPWHRSCAGAITIGVHWSIRPVDRPWCGNGRGSCARPRYPTKVLLKAPPGVATARPKSRDQLVRKGETPPARGGVECHSRSDHPDRRRPSPLPIRTVLLSEAPSYILSGLRSAAISSKNVGGQNCPPNGHFVVWETSIKSRSRAPPGWDTNLTFCVGRDLVAIAAPAGRSCQTVPTSSSPPGGAGRPCNRPALGWLSHRRAESTTGDRHRPYNSPGGGVRVRPTGRGREGTRPDRSCNMCPFDRIIPSPLAPPCSLPVV